MKQIPREIVVVEIGALRFTARRISDLRTARRPLRDHVQVRWETPRAHRFEHPILQNEVARVRPIVGQLGLRVVAHLRLLVTLHDASRNIGWATAGAIRCVHDGDKAVHLAAVDREIGGFCAVGAAGVFVTGVVIGTHARAGLRIGNADLRETVAHRDAIGAGEGAEVTIEGAVLLHDDDDVLDFMNTVVCSDGARRNRDGSNVTREKQSERDDAWQRPAKHESRRSQPKAPIPRQTIQKHDCF